MLVELSNLSSTNSACAEDVNQKPSLPWWKVRLSDLQRQPQFLLPLNDSSEYSIEKKEVESRPFDSIQFMEDDDSLSVVSEVSMDLNDFICCHNKKPDSSTVRRSIFSSYWNSSQDSNITTKSRRSSAFKKAKQFNRRNSTMSTSTTSTSETFVANVRRRIDTQQADQSSDCSVRSLSQVG